MYCYALCSITTDRDGLLQSHEVDKHFRSLYKSHTHGLHNHMDYCTCMNAYINNNTYNIAQIILNTTISNLPFTKVVLASQLHRIAFAMYPLNVGRAGRASTNLHNSKLKLVDTNSHVSITIPIANLVFMDRQPPCVRHPIITKPDYVIIRSTMTDA